MSGTDNKSLSESNIPEQVGLRTPPNFVNQRTKTKRGPDYDNDALLELKEEIKHMISSMMATQNEDIRKIYSTLVGIKNTNTSIESAMANLSAQNEDLQKKIEQLEIRSKRDNDYIIILEDKIEDLQRGSRKSSLELKNVPKMVNESKDDLVNMITTLSDVVKSRIEPRDIKDIYRVQNKRTNTKNSTVIINLGSTLLKTDFMKKVKEYNRNQKDKICAKHLGFTSEEYTPIYMSEQLTAKGARLHFLARDLAKSKQYKFCWTSYGIIYVKKDDSSPTIVIKSEAQVHNLLQEK